MLRNVSVTMTPRMFAPPEWVQQINDERMWFRPISPIDGTRQVVFFTRGEDGRFIERERATYRSSDGETWTRVDNPT